MRFVHCADCHLGGWRDPKLSEITVKAFSQVIEYSIHNQVDFVIIAGDLFNTSLPSVDMLTAAVTELRKLKEHGIPVYLIAGSHDYSPSGKSMLTVLEQAGLCTNVVKGRIIEDKIQLTYTLDIKTGAKITGMLGKRVALEKKIYEHLDLEYLEREEGFKIFVFHTAIGELNTQDINITLTTPLSLFPKKCAYYAGGHVHTVLKKEIENYGLFAYPGPLFPNNFKELEELKHGGFYLYDKGNLIWNPIEIKPVVTICIDATNKTPEHVTTEMIEQLKQRTVNDAIILIRVEGTLKLGKPMDIAYTEVYDWCFRNNAYSVMKNTAKLTSAEFEEVKILQKENIEEALIKEHCGKIKVEGLSLEKEMALTQQLIQSLDTEKGEGETALTYEERIKRDVKQLLGINF